MCFVLPKRGHTVAPVLERMTQQPIDSFLPIQSEYVHVRIPKFKSKCEIEVIDKLKKLGIEDWRHLEGISKVDELEVTKVYSKSSIEVTEEFTEAFALTYAVGGCGAGRKITPRYVNFTANRPFVYFIMHRRTNTVLFIGTYVRVPESRS